MNTKRIKQLHGEIRTLKFELDILRCELEQERGKVANYHVEAVSARALADSYKAKADDAGRVLDNVCYVTQLASGLSRTIDSIIKKS